MFRFKTNMGRVVSSLTTKLESFQTGGEDYDALLRTVTTSMIGVVKNRIHEKGKASDGTVIGTYSKKPTYISLSASPRKFRPKGKNSNKAVFKNGNPRMSGYFSGGYEQFKTEIGRNQLGTVNLSLSGQLNSQLTVVPTSRGYGFGWPDREKLIRARALEKKYKKKIWALTEGERKQVSDITIKYFRNAIS